MENNILRFGQLCRGREWERMVVIQYLIVPGDDILAVICTISDQKNKGSEAQKCKMLIFGKCGL